jgi:hypothetical protein
MVIQNGATLTVNADYYCYGNITLNGGNIIGSGKLIFYNHKSVNVAQGTNQIYGSSSQNPLELDFIAPHHMNGIQVLQGAIFRAWNCIIRNARFGITVHSNTNYFRASNVQFYNCSSGGINISGPLSLTPIITLCQFNDLSNGLIAANLSEINIQYNHFINNDRGINLINVANTYISNNSIISNKIVSQGIFLESCNGVIRKNYISGHTNAIHLGNSSPDIGVNVITNNLYHGIYVGTGSLPKMDARLFFDPPEYYPIAGYNQIWENGGTTTGGPIDNDGSEIFFNNSNAVMQKGCNSIYDDRAGGREHPPYNTKLLMNGIAIIGPIHIQAEGNFWSDNPQYPLEERFGNLLVDYEPFFEAPCEVPGGGEEGEELFVKSSAGEIIDTLYPIQREIENPSSTDLLYAVAEEKLISADYEGAEVIYNQIVNGNDSLDIKLPAYRRLYDIGKLSLKPISYFNDLKNIYSSLIPLTNDSLRRDIFNQLSNLSLVGEEEYVQAIGEFDDVIQQNPGSEKAVYAEIDAITTSLLIEGEDSTLHKGRLGKYLIKNSNDYSTRIDEILKKHFGSGAIQSEEETLPTEYTLYQNYPNPFNPITTIKYDLPNAGDVSLIIYDILGRKVKELVNTKQEAGRYEIQYNASSLASGVYIYQLISEKYISAKKMIFLK